MVFLTGRTLDPGQGVFGIVILRADSDDEARALMDNDPGMRQGLMRAELFPYRIALYPAAG